MILTTPQPFTAAVKHLRARHVMPTRMGSEELRVYLQSLPPQIARRAKVVSRMADKRMLDAIFDKVDRIVSGEGPNGQFPAAPGQMMDVTRAKGELKAYFESLGYKSTDKEKGTIFDFTSDKRLSLILEMNVRQALNFGQYTKDTQDPTTLNLFPAWELVRVSPRRHPRGEIPGADQFAQLSDEEAFGGNYWPRVWHQNGGKFYGRGRMIALKTDPIWEAISYFHLPYPPFHFRSGIGVQQIKRKEAKKLGVLAEGVQLVPPSLRDFATDAESSLAADPAAPQPAPAQPENALKPDSATWLGWMKKLAGKLGFTK